MLLLGKSMPAEGLTGGVSLCDVGCKAGHALGICMRCNGVSRNSTDDVSTWIRSCSNPMNNDHMGWSQVIVTGDSPLLSSRD
eukprot:6326793-Amphidinium_carterae.1